MWSKTYESLTTAREIYCFEDILDRRRQEAVYARQLQDHEKLILYCKMGLSFTHREAARKRHMKSVI